MRKMASKDTEDRVMNVDELVKSCNVLEDNEKVKICMKKYEELLKLYHKMEYGSNSMRREVSHLTTENNRLILARSKLESLCRELQKQNKVIKDETTLKIHEEEEKRRQITQEFQNTLTNVSTMMTDSNTQNMKLGEENKQMAVRLSSIYEEFKTRESEVDRITKQIDLEKQLCEARCAKMKTEFMMERQELLVENEALNQKIAALTRDLVDTSKSCAMLEQQVASLTSQIEVYTGKYQEFETTITKSGRIFDHCKSEIDKLNKQIKVLEKEVTEWQNRYKKNINTIYELQLDNTEKTKVIDNVTRKQTQLTKLCRQLQVERKAYINTLREIGYDPNDIIIDFGEDDSTVEEVQPSTSEHTCSDSKRVARGKVTTKSKRGKQKGKKGKEMPPEHLIPPMTLKEIQLAEFEEAVLDQVQQHVLKIQSMVAQSSCSSEKTQQEPCDDVQEISNQDVQEISNQDVREIFNQDVQEISNQYVQEISNQDVQEISNQNQTSTDDTGNGAQLTLATEPDVKEATEAEVDKTDPSGESDETTGENDETNVQKMTNIDPEILED